MKNKKKILLTGGHLSPLIAVYDELKNKADVVIIGRKFIFERDNAESLEYKLFKDKNVSFYGITAPRLQRKFTGETLSSFLKLPKAIFDSFKIIKKENPDAVLIFGGYIGLPVAIIAYILKKPIVIHEQTLGAGLANRLIAKLASKICISFPSSRPYFNEKKVVLTGNPLRSDVFDVRKDFTFKSKKPIMYITGGSSGSQSINNFILKIQKELLKKFNVIHQTGSYNNSADYKMLQQRVKELSTELQERYILREFIYPSEIGWIYKNSDIVISRAGINTVCELISLSKRALLIPLPYGQRNEQLRNAQMYKDTGLGGYILQENLTLENFFKEIDKILNIKTKKSNIKRIAAKKIIDVVISV